MDDLDDNTKMRALTLAGDNMESVISGKYLMESKFVDQQRIAGKNVSSLQVEMSLERRQE